jgi:hypothetical protein
MERERRLPAYLQGITMSRESLAGRHIAITGAASGIGLATATLFAAKGARVAEADARVDARHHMAFGYGAHACIGAPIARLEERIALETLFQRFEGPRLNSDTMSCVPISSLRVPQRLHLQWRV